MPQSRGHYLRCIMQQHFLQLHYQRSSKARVQEYKTSTPALWNTCKCTHSIRQRVTHSAKAVLQTRANKQHTGRSQHCTCPSKFWCRVIEVLWSYAPWVHAAEKAKSNVAVNKILGGFESIRLLPCEHLLADVERLLSACPENPLHHQHCTQRH